MNLLNYLPNDKDLDFWIANNYNVLFYGKHGVGKTSIIVEAFKRNKLKYLTFSASTMDPWVDFIGVPKEKTDSNGSYLELVRPKDFRDDQVEALFFDELNRSHKKIRNAIMELIQFKSINGKKYPNLRFIWGAVNPADDADNKYDVEELDAAQADRFHIRIEIPYKPQIGYFKDKYGKKIAEAIIDWWHELPQSLQKEISPRRLEYVIDIFKAGGDLAHVITPKSNIDKLKHALTHGSPMRELKILLTENNYEKLTVWLKNENNFAAVEYEVCNNHVQLVSLLDEEKIISLMLKHVSVHTYVFQNYAKFEKIIKNIAENSFHSNLKNTAKKVLAAHNVAIDTDNSGKIFNVPLTFVTSAQVKTFESFYAWNEKCMPVIQASKRYTKYTSLQECVLNLTAYGDSSDIRIDVARCTIAIIISRGDNLTKVDAKNALRLLEAVASRTQRNTLLKRCYNIYYATWKCLRILRNAAEYTTVKQFVSDCPFLSTKLYTDYNMNIDKSEFAICIPTKSI